MFQCFVLLSGLLSAAAISPCNVAEDGSKHAFASVDDYELLADIVLVASIDGKFHALNRTDGQKLWSMSDFLANVSVSPSLAPLVRTTHPKHSLNAMKSYIVEPQSGDIYIQTSPSTTLKHFQFSVPELVDISPFASVEDDTDGGRIFFGRKETSLLVIDIDTGEIKATFDAMCPIDTHQKQCPSFRVECKFEVEKSSLIFASRVVYIKRTDYHLSGYKRSQLKELPPVELSFSTYGPYDQDINANLQPSYHRTHDKTYLQMHPGGMIHSFRNFLDPTKTPEEGTRPLWGRSLTSPAVAAFDILRPRSTTSSRSPFILLQPQPTLADLFPGVPANALPHSGSAYVGVIEESGSLFVMSSTHFPFVAIESEKRDRIGSFHDDPEGIAGFFYVDD
ncbi:hypothetical protein BDN70DRAFT_990482 [Pholiota conissans]|uniref:ER membrane protein complex subunit 1 n=1 Tax=Pholiota conissans TaxID=109636 RepID=A0A9P5Z904_9AGAR|nr:hypothetical protein BDN70DRAFT_990482 [Pholiota conissans]